MHGEMNLVIYENLVFTHILCLFGLLFELRELIKTTYNMFITCFYKFVKIAYENSL